MKKITVSKKKKVVKKVKNTADIVPTKSKVQPKNVSTTATAQSRIDPPEDIQTKEELFKLKVPKNVMKQSTYYQPEVMIQIPDETKTFLVDDHCSIVERHHVLFLPSKFNIRKVLNDYLKTKTNPSKLPPNHTYEGYIDFLTSLQLYFKLLLKDKLLYPLEQQQFDYMQENYADLMQKLQDDHDLQTKNQRSKVKGGSKKSNASAMKATTSSTNPGPTIVATGHDEDKPVNDSQSQTSESTSSESLPSTISSTIKSQSSTSGQQTFLEIVDDPTTCDFLTLYSPVHLLRLFTILGRYLFYTRLGNEQMALTLSYIHDLLKYLNKILFTDGQVIQIKYADSHHYHINKIVQI